jgi:hypothetical protein
MTNATPLTAEELEAGLRVLEQGVVGANAFWDANLIAFRQTIRAAIRETSELLLAKHIPPRWRSELEIQLEALHGYVEVVDRYAAKRAGNWQGATLN